MPKTTLYDINANQIGEIELNDNVFGAQINENALHTMVVNTCKSKAGTQTPRQNRSFRRRKEAMAPKGTGRAVKAAFVHLNGQAAVLHWGQSQEPSFSVNKKLRRVAMKSAPHQSCGNNIIVVENLDMQSYKTKEFADILQKFNAENALVVTAERMRML